MEHARRLYIAYQNRRERRQEIIYHNLIDRQNPLEHFSETEIFTNFRFRRDTLLYILNLLQPYLSRLNNRGHPLPTLFELLVAIKFLATNSFHLVTGQALGLRSSKSTSWNCARRVIRALVATCKDHIAIANTEETKRRFYLLSGTGTVSIV